MESDEFLVNQPPKQLPNLNEIVEEPESIDRSDDLCSHIVFPFDLNEEPSGISMEGNTEDAEPILNADDPCSHMVLPFDLNEEPPGINMEGTEEEVESSAIVKLRKFLTNEERKEVHCILLENVVHGKLKKGVLSRLALSFSVSIKSIQRIWLQVKHTGTVGHRKASNCGRKRVELDINGFREIHLSMRRTFRTMAKALNVSKSSMHRHLKNGAIRRHSNAIKPLLTSEHQRARLQFCLSMLEMDSIPHDPTFNGMYNIIHIDEKWFYLSKKTENYYLLPDEEEPLRTCRSKNFIPKVMFLVAVARPRFDAQGNEVFSGKIGVFPLVTKEPAKQTSVNRVVGTLETKPIISVSKEVTKRFLIEKVLPAIRTKWPKDDIRRPIIIQQDNARTHPNIDDEDFCRAAAQDGFNIRLMCQPANSPDLNVLDLGFFRAIQALQHNEAPKTVDDLISAVLKAYEDFSTVESDRIFITLQTCMIEIMKEKGSNKYKIPHIKKSILAREGRLPRQMKCEPALVQEVINYLNTSNIDQDAMQREEATARGNMDGT